MFESTNDPGGGPGAGPVSDRGAAVGKSALPERSAALDRNALPERSAADVVLIVDDVPDNLSVLHDALDEAGYTVLVATGGETALQRAAQAQPDIVLLDAMMPGMDGFEVARRLKRMPETAHIPIVFMTGLTETEHVVAAFDAGGVDYVTKPIRPKEVLARIVAHMQSAREKRQARNALDAFGHATIAVRAGDFRLVWQTPLARSLLPAYFDAVVPGQLPVAVVEWLRGEAAVASAGAGAGAGAGSSTGSGPGASVVPGAGASGAPAGAGDAPSRAGAGAGASASGGAGAGASASPGVVPSPPDREPRPFRATRGERQLLISLQERTADDDWLLVMREVSDARTVDAMTQHWKLTMREAEVLYWVVKGKTNRDIGDILGSSPATVKKHLERVYVKLGVETRTAAAAVATGRVGR